MTSVDIVKAIGGLLWTGMGIVFVLFVNFLIRRSNPDGVFGIPLPGQWVHAAFGPILVAVNGALLVFFCALLQTPVDNVALAQVQTLQVKWVFGPLCNPFYVGSNSLLTGCGYAFLIVLWWIGMHTFLYSIGLNSDPDGYLGGKRSSL